MTTETGFDRLATALWDSDRIPGPKSRLLIAEKPEPFVAPTFVSSEPAGTELFAAEVIFVEAPAAVGKTTMARFLSASRHAPLLDLAKVPVATGSLKSLISDLPGTNPMDDFHDAKLPLIIDALDEGRMLSGEKGFEAFLETTGELILSERREIHRPKIVVLGRPESIDLARLGLEISGGGISMSSLRVGFFGETSAHDMINAYALSVARTSAAYRKNPAPVRALVDAYFDAIEVALGLSKGQLWIDPMGRAFAGYAPVLSALGLLLAEVDNFLEIENRLRSEGTNKAWGVIEDVLTTILDREKEKLCGQLASKISIPVPDEAYDAREQLTYITQYVHGQPLADSSRVRLPSKDRLAYESLVSGYLKEHPFVREGKLENAVLGSVVLAHAVIHDLLGTSDLGQLAILSKQPFLWRSVRKQLSDGSLLDGRYLGYLLASFWNEPVPQDDKIIIRSLDGDSARVFVSTRGKETPIVNVMLPVTLFGQLRDCDIDVAGAIELQGQVRGSQSFFEVHGATTIICEEMQLKVESLVLHGDVWFEADSVTSSPNLEIVLKNGSKIGWAGQLAGQYPWKRFKATLEPPYSTVAGDRLTKLLEECSRRLPGAVTFNADYSVVVDKRMRWALRDYGAELPIVMKLLVDHQLASRDAIPVNLMQIHLKISWSELLAAMKAADPPKHLRQFLDDVRSKIKG